MSGGSGGTHLLEVRDLTVDIGAVRVLDGISLTVDEGEVLGLVGESGSGKSLTALAVMGLLPRGARVVTGEVLFRGEDLLTLPEARLRRLRGRDIAMVFQDAMSAMNPLHTVGGQIGEALRLHGAARGGVRERVVGLLDGVRVSDPAVRAAAYPHQFSGGMLQRSVIAMGMAHAPALLIADEPTTALDVTVQAQVLDVLREQRGTTGSAMILVSHDLGVIAAQADRMAVMYAGRLVETGPVGDVFAAPAHPYTAGLLAALIDVAAPAARAYAIPGRPPGPAERPEGCAFRPRCGLSADRLECRRPVPLRPVAGRPSVGAPGADGSAVRGPAGAGPDGVPGESVRGPSGAGPDGVPGSSVVRPAGAGPDGAPGGAARHAACAFPDEVPRWAAALRPAGAAP